MQDIRPAGFFLKRSEPQKILDLTKMSLRWLLELFRQKSALQGCHIVPKPEVDEATPVKERG